MAGGGSRISWAVALVTKGEMSDDSGWRIAVVVPCYNEAARLDVRQFQEYLAQDQRVCLIFVDDGSRDNTFEVLQRLAADGNGQAEVIRAGQNRGKAEAVRLGVNHAMLDKQIQVIGYWDADLATPLDAIDQFLAVLEERPSVEMVFGSRVKLLGRHVERLAARHYLGRVFATAVSIMLKLAIYDTQCGAKLFRVSPNTRDVFAAPFLSKWIFDVEILARYLNLYGRDTKQLENAIFEFPLHKWTDIAGSKVRPHHFTQAALDLMRIRARYLSS